MANTTKKKSKAPTPKTKKSSKPVKKTKSQDSIEEVELITISERSITLFLAIVISGALIAGAIYFGLKGGVRLTTVNTNANSGTEVKTEEPKEEDTSAVVSIDDDAKKGNPEAKVVIVEFSDFECPYCHRYFDQTYPQIMKDYVDTDKVMYVFRDLPLYFHDPAATDEANAAECVHHALGDKAYFEFHDKVFSNSAGNGDGVEEGSLKKWAVELGMSGDEFDKCVKDKTYQDEINKDSQDANSVGIGGTPSFVIGIIDENGNVDGEKLIGAQPYTVFKATIEKYLAKSE